MFWGFHSVRVLQCRQTTTENPSRVNLTVERFSFSVYQNAILPADEHVSDTG